MKYLITGALFFLLACASNGGIECPEPPPCPTCPEPPPCPTCPECPDCPVVPPPPPPPPPPPVDACEIPLHQRVRTDYIPVARAEHWQGELQDYDNDLHNNGYVNPWYALQHCGPGSGASVFPYGGLSAEQVVEIMRRARAVKVALTGEDGRSGFYARLVKPHRDHGPGRSQVFRPCFTQWVGQARELLYGDGTPSNPRGPVAGLDGIKGACKEKLGQ